MLIDDALSMHCEIKEVAGVPSPGTSAAPGLSASDSGVILRYGGPTGRGDGLRHFIVTFQDKTFECVAKGFTVASAEQEGSA